MRWTVWTGKAPFALKFWAHPDFIERSSTKQKTDSSTFALIQSRLSLIDAGMLYSSLFHRCASAQVVALRLCLVSVNI